MRQLDAYSALSRGVQWRARLHSYTPLPETQVLEREEGGGREEGIGGEMGGGGGGGKGDVILEGHELH